MYVSSLGISSFSNYNFGFPATKISVLPIGAMVFIDY